MFNCNNSWLDAQSYLAQSMNEKALSSLSQCFEVGNFHPQIVHQAVTLLDEQGQSVQALHLLEMASRHHIYHPQLELLKHSLLELRDLPGSISPLAVLNQDPIYFSWFAVLLLCALFCWVLWRFSPLRKVIVEKIKMPKAKNSNQQANLGEAKNFSLFLFKSSETLLLIALLLGAIFCTFIAGVNHWDDYQNSQKPAFIVKSDSALYEKSAGPAALAQVQGGTLGKIVDASDLGDIAMRWPGKKYLEPKAADRTRVKVVFSSGQSGYLWEDQILLLEKQK